MRLRRARVLVVEQHKASAAVLRLMLASRGHSCEVAETIEQALDYVRIFRPHVVFYEWFQPGGRDFARAARSIAESGERRLAVITLSTQEEPPDFRETAEVHGYIVKPYRAEEIEAVIASAMRDVRLHDWPKMERRGESVSAADVSAFEKRLGHALPQEYRQFLLDVNGGRPDRDNAQFEGGVINRLFSLDDSDESRNLEIRARRQLDQLPTKDLLFVGHDWTGGALLLSLAGAHRGEVWLHVSDERPAGSNPRVEWHDRRDMKKLADNFEAFMRSLKPVI